MADNISVKMVTREEIPRVVDYLIEFYFTDEPLSKDLNLTSSPRAVDFLRRFCTNALKEDLSLIATNQSGEIAAVSCNQILRKNQKFHFDEDPKVMEIAKFVLKAINEARVFEHFPDVDEAIYIAFMSVHPNFRNRGLAKQLIDETRLLALKRGLKVMRMDCCSLYTAKAAQRFGWQCLNEIKYVDYKINGVQVFNPEAPHTRIGVYATRIDQTTTKMADKISVRMVTREDIPRIVQYLIDFYFTDEPLSKDLNLTSSPRAVDFLRRFCTNALKEDLSLIATNQSGEIAAVSCNQILRKNQKFHFDEDPKVMEIAKFVLKAINEARVFEHFPDVDEAIYIAFMSVHPNFRNRGLAKQLIDETRLLALKRGLKVMRMDCCSLYTAKAAQRFGWKCLNEIKYVDYKINGVQVFNPEAPHTRIGVYATRIDQTTTKMADKISVRMVTREDIPRIVQYLIDFYFTDEPLSKDLNLTSSPRAVDFLRRFCTNALKEDLSLIATNQSGEIAAVSCNQILRKNQKFHFDEDPKVMEITKFVLKAVNEAKVFDYFPDVDEAIYIAFMSVHPNFRNRGLAKQLIDETRLLALKRGLKVMRMDCCSLYTAKAAQRFGWQCLNEIKYVNYKINGVQVFNPEAPHTRIGVYATRIDQTPVVVKSSM